MSLCFLRSVSPIHIQYLKNMGVAATLVVSLMVSGKLWGLISCHHYSPRFLNFELRSVCELLAEVLGTRIAALESFTRGQGELAARRLEQRMTEWIARDGDWRGALFDRSRPLLLPLGATGAALLFEGEILTTGDVPSTDDIREIARWARPLLKQGSFATANLSALEPAFGPLAGIASGLLAVTISNQSDDMLIWFRHERVRTVTWGGDPVEAGLGRRRSVRTVAAPVVRAMAPDREGHLGSLDGGRHQGGATDPGEHQRRRRPVSRGPDPDRAGSARSGVAQGSRVRTSRSSSPTPAGHVIQSNAGFAEWLGVEPGALRRIDDLPRFFEDPDDARDCGSRRWWPRTGPGAAKPRSSRLTAASIPVLVRADPVFVAPDRVLGFVLLFADLTDGKAAHSARRRFQEDILRNQRQFLTVARRERRVVQRLMSSVVENAQLAALEITEGTEIAEVPDLLEAVGVSVSRTVEVLRAAPAVGPRNSIEWRVGVRGSRDGARAFVASDRPSVRSLLSESDRRRS